MRNKQKIFAQSLFIATLFIFLLYTIPTVYAQNDHITLLTVTEGDETQGGVADLYLKIESGTGEVFLDSFPLTKIDTQSSIRYANRVACSYLQKDCSRYNFYYTIRANSAIVGGPSAGAAIAVLTVAALDNQDIDQKLAITGTINSGGIVGPVAGIGAKVGGARSAGITTVLIPALGATEYDSDEEKSSLVKKQKYSEYNVSNPNIDNSDINNSDSNYSDDSYSETNNSGTFVKRSIVNQTPLITGIDVNLTKNGVKVIRIASIQEVLWYATGKNYTKTLPPVVPPKEYVERMSDISSDLCKRTILLQNILKRHNVQYNDTNNYTGRAYATNQSYSRASLCFSANIELAKLEMSTYNIDERIDILTALKKNASLFETGIKNRTISTISDLETYAIVQERALEAKQILNDLNSTNPDSEELGYAQERLLSAQIWSRFFGMSGGKDLPVDRRYLRIACLTKLSEAEERASYIRMYAPMLLFDVEKNLNDARMNENDEPILCIFSASKAMAQANMLASALALGENNVDALIGQKMSAADDVLRREQQNGFFPIIGYSYMQYAADLRSSQPYSSLSFVEYSLELSTIDVYFPQKHSWYIPQWLIQSITIFMCGLIFGIVITIFILQKQKSDGMNMKSTVKNNSRINPKINSSEQTISKKRKK